ncbi:integrase [Yersinia intermedia]|uniref:phage integrase Arm DNA-binding domain-containing protein n=1 Tax=Yersinia intermedia TaxID=631 RepID=UPI0005E0CA48|nr:phage integrase Arm DNA-binding domain-containing protein [Yersinia intermedia]CNH14358.1 integrase [Yersinia intermedia]CQD78152.1 integrase [Yersinia intermedia]
MARPRKYNINVPGLSCYTDARTKKLYWRYKHPITRKFHGLGSDEAAATAIAIEANTRFAKQQMGQLLKARDEISINVGKSITVHTWLDRYLAIQQERYDTKEIKLNTLKQKNAPVEAFRRSCGILNLPDVGARDIASILEEYKDKGQKRMAQIVRMVLIDVYKEAQHAGEVPPGYNPALATKQPANKVTRVRLNFSEWDSIFNAASELQHYIQNAMLLALVTGQRLGDISKMKFSDIWDDHLHIVQEKTGVRLAIPLSIRCDVLGYSLQDVITRCRDLIISPHILHYHHTTSKAKRGGKVSSYAITTGFSVARDKSGLQWKEGTPPTFHEQRSLAERLYREQGVDTKTLLGHKNQAMTDKYNDDRGKEWTVLAV